MKRIFFHIINLNGNQMVSGPKDTFSANCKLGLIKRKDRSFKKNKKKFKFQMVALLC